MRVDTHLHVYADPAQGFAEVASLPIVEFGNKADVPLVGVWRSLATLSEADYDYGVVLGSYEGPGYPERRSAVTGRGPAYVITAATSSPITRGCVGWAPIILS